MKKRANVLWMLLLAVAVGVSCSAKEEAGAESGKMLPAKIQIKGDSEAMSFSYDNNDRITKIEAMHGGSRYTILLAYTDKLIVVERQDYQTGVARTYWIDSCYLTSPIQVDIHVNRNLDQSNPNRRVNTLIMENGKCIQYSWMMGAEMDKYSYDNNGNRILTTWLDGSVQRGTYTNTYNAHKGIFSQVATPDWLLWDLLGDDVLSVPGFMYNNIVSNHEVNDDKGEWSTAFSYPGRQDFPDVVDIKETYDDGNEEAWTVDVTYQDAVK